VPSSVYQFGDFRLDCGRFELTRNGQPLSVERKPLELLILLAERKGQLVTRAEIAERLWEREVFVDTEHGINTAIRKIRQTLRDDSDEPSFVQTVMGKGYRFVAPVAVQSRADGEAGLAHPDDDLPAGRTTAAEPALIAPKAVDQEAAHPEATGNRPRWRWLAWAIPGLLLAAVSVGLAARSWMHRQGVAEAGIHSLAVLPLDNLSGDPSQEYFADGMTDELITMLARDSTLRITSRTSVMQYKGAHRPLPEIARSLGVDVILEGSVARSGDKVHMTLQLIRADSDAHLWAESYDRNVRDMPSLTEEGARAIANRLHRAVVAAPPMRYVSPEAHDAYMRGRYLWFGLDYDEAVKYYRKATELQPDYALGWAGLSMCYTAATMDPENDPRAWLPPSDGTAARALQLDPSLPDAHLAVGGALFLLRWEFEAADQEARRAIELDPRYAEAYHFRARILSAINRKAEAIAAQKQQMDLDPFARPWALAYTYYQVGDYDKAIEDARLRLKTYPQDTRLLESLADSYRSKGMTKEAALMLENEYVASSDTKSAVAVRRAYEQGGYKAVVRWQISAYEKQANTGYLSPVLLASLHAQLGHREQTLALLEEGYRQHAPLLLWIQTRPEYDFLHGDPRYRALVQKIGLPPTY
jgi:TolB-like protein/DNA-binding winged helix-turn-helix (wHTH) protein